MCCILQSLNPRSLDTLFGDSLTPDLLSGIVSSLTLPNTVSEDESQWKIDLLKGLKKVKRFGLVVGFLEEGEREGQSFFFTDCAVT